MRDQPAGTESPPRVEQDAVRRTRKLRRRLCFVAVLGLLTLLSAEGVLRIYVALRGWTPNCYAAHLDLLRPHPVNGYDLKPEFELRSGVFRISTNSLGLRGPEIHAEKPPGVTRIAVVGGSSVFGYLVSDGDEAARLLERDLNETGCRVEVINAGVPGYNLFHSLVRYREVVSPLKPDIVVLYAGHNDLGYVCSDEPDAPRWRDSHIAPAWERLLGRSTLYGFLAYRLLQRGSMGPVGTQIERRPTSAGIRQFEDNLAAMAEAVNESGAELVVCAQAMAARPGVDENLQARLGTTEDEVQRAIAMSSRMQESLRNFADERNIVFLDAGTAIPPTGEFLGDEIHLTAAGEERLAAMLRDGLVPLLPNCQGPADDSNSGP